MLPTPEAIRAADGPRLTRCAWSLGLAPAGVLWDERWMPQVTTPCWEEGGILCPSSRPWQPHVDLAQAEGVFRSLRARGWSTAQEWLSTLGNGTILATKGFPGGPVWARYLCHYVTEADEGLALLRVSVLAVASETTTESRARGLPA